MLGCARVLITGGAGYIGSRLARRLAAKGTVDSAVTIVALDNLHRGKFEALSTLRNSVQFIEGDIREKAAMDAAAKDVDLIFHLAAESAVMAADADPEYCFETNVTGTFRVLQAAKANGVRRVIFSSSREVYGDPENLPVGETAPLRPKNAYGSSKAAAEMCCGAFVNEGLEVAIVRLSNVYGPGDRGRVIPRFVESAVTGAPLTLFGGRQVMDFVWIENVVDALVRSGFGPYVPGPLNVASGKGISIMDLGQRVIRTAGSASPVEIVPKREVEVECFVADVSAAKAALGLKTPDDPLFGLPEVIEAARV
jgi:nucleoside-diphosphate-sugar epimerase